MFSITVPFRFFSGDNKAKPTSQVVRTFSTLQIGKSREHPNDF